MFNILSILRSE
jgi:hypothetical protein